CQARYKAEPDTDTSQNLLLTTKITDGKPDCPIGYEGDDGRNFNILQTSQRAKSQDLQTITELKYGGSNQQGGGNTDNLSIVNGIHRIIQIDIDRRKHIVQYQKHQCKDRCENDAQ